MGALTMYQIFIIGMIATFIKPIIKYIFKLILGLIITSICILCSDYLSSFGYLKYISLSIIDFLDSHSFFKLSKLLPLDTPNSIINKDLPLDNNIEVSNPIIEVTKHNSDVAKPVVEVTDPNVNKLFRSEYVTKNNINTEINNTSSLYTNIGLVCLGVIGAIGLIMVSDHFAHDTVQNVPIVNTIADSVHTVWNNITGYFHKPDPSDLESPKYIRPSNYVVDSPEAISRLSSTQSGNTITQEQLDFYYQEAQRIITPPESRSITPVTVINGN